MSKPANNRTAKPAKQRTRKSGAVKVEVAKPSLSMKTAALNDRKEATGTARNNRAWSRC